MFLESVVLLMHPRDESQMYSDVVQRFRALCLDYWKSATSNDRWSTKRCRYLCSSTVFNYCVFTVQFNL